MSQSKKINVLSLFDGMSCGRIALERAGVEVDNYYSSEIDKYAIQVADKNYPEDTVNRLGDITQITSERLDKLPKIDLIIGGSPCFVAGTKVITRTYYKNIEEVEIGDEVLTHTGKFKKVLRVGGKSSDTLKIIAQGFKPTITTVEHPYYIRTKSRKWNNKKRCYDVIFSEPKWVKASQLKKGDFLGQHINKLSENPLKLTKEECYILGRYIADGHTRKDYRTSEGRPNDRHWQLILSIGRSKVCKFISKVNENHFSNYSHTENVNRIVFSNKRLVEIAEKYCGINAINKIIPQIFINLPQELLKEVLDGYLEGDGSFKNGVFRATSISEDLIMTLSQAIAKVYNTNSSYIFTKRPKTTIIEGRIVNQKDTYSIEFRKKMKKQTKAKLINDIIWTPLRCVENLEKTERVFNLEVEEDNSYTANNAIVHNCQGFSFAGKRKGSSTKTNLDVLSLNQYLELKKDGFEFEGQSYLFWEYIRVLTKLKEKNPNIMFMLENVVMSQKWRAMFDSAIGTTAININSNLVSAQNRKRLYWTNIPNISQPEDKGVLLYDLLETKSNGEHLRFNVDEIIFHKVKPNVRLNIIKNHDAIMNSSKTTFIMPVKSDFSDNKVCITKSITLRASNSCAYVLDKPSKTYRKLTVTECERLQTVADGYTSALLNKKNISDTQRYKMLGNGWTVDVIAHIFKGMK